jgi:hypothetical protein
MPPKKDKKKKDKKAKPMKRTQQQKGKGQTQKQTQIVNISLARTRARAKPPVSNIPINLIRMNEPPLQLASQPMYQQPLREPLKEPTAPSILLPTAPVAGDAVAVAEAGTEAVAGKAKRGPKPLSEEEKAIRDAERKAARKKAAENKKFEKRLEKQIAEEELARQRLREEGLLPPSSMPVMPSSEARKTGGGKK